MRNDPQATAADRYNDAVLLGLLPALRDLRAPLVAGYVTLLAAYLLFGDEIPERADARGAVSALYDLSDLGGRTSLLVVLTAVAFLLGNVVQFAVQAVARWRRNRGPGPRHSWRNEVTLRLYIVQLLDDGGDLARYARNRGYTSEDVGLDITREVQAEIPRIARRLRGAENELYDEYDRLIGEAELREITVIPLALLIVALGITWSPFCLPALAVVPILQRQANWQREAGNDVIIDAVMVEKVAAPALERLRRRAALA